jgi:hypothetical protein
MSGIHLFAEFLDLGAGDGAHKLMVGGSNERYSREFHQAGIQRGDGL